MRLQTHCELKEVETLKGQQIAVAYYQSTPTTETILLDLEIESEDRTHVICFDKNTVYHAVPKSAVYNPLINL